MRLTSDNLCKTYSTVNILHCLCAIQINVSISISSKRRLVLNISGILTPEILFQVSHLSN